MSELVTQVDRRIGQQWPGFICHHYGHVGDTNLHIVVASGDREVAHHDEVNEVVYGCVREAGGTISAEHGIGTRKKAYLGYSRTPIEFDLMRLLKRSLDPMNILNPGKVIDVHQ